MEPEVLILDEPTAGLDPIGRESIMQNIRNYHDAKNATIIIVSHSMEDMARVADRIVVVNDGRLPLIGEPSEVFAHGEELRNMGLATPQLTQVFQQLKNRGLDVPNNIYTMEDAKAALLALAERRNGRC